MNFNAPKVDQNAKKFKNEMMTQQINMKIYCRKYQNWDNYGNKIKKNQKIKKSKNQKNRIFFYFGLQTDIQFRNGGMVPCGE